MNDISISVPTFNIEEDCPPVFPKFMPMPNKLR